MKVGEFITSISLSFSLVLTQQTCQTFNNKTGVCKIISQCKYLENMLNDKYRTPTETRYLRASHCGYQGREPKVCCPDINTECFTPENDLGQCVNIYKCPEVAELIEKHLPLPPDAVSYFRKLACNGTESNSICCSGKIFIDLEPNNNTNDSKETATCGLTLWPSIEGRISGGNTTQITQYPWMGLVECRTAVGQIQRPCGASLISKRYLVTAAHCVHPTSPIAMLCTPTAVRLGEHDLSNTNKDCARIENRILCADKPVVISIEKIINHPQFENGKEPKNDIALLRLAKDAQFTNHISPICLPTEDITVNLKDIQEIFIVAGWGRTEEMNSSNKLKHLNLHLVDLIACQRAYENTTMTKKLWNKQFCAGGEDGKDTCFGDSGGPLMRLWENHYELTGVISYGTKRCGIKNIPGVYTKVYAYKDWIMDQMTP